MECKISNDSDRGQMNAVEELKDQFSELIAETRRLKPEDRSDIDRRYAVLITEIEKSYAYFMHFIFNSWERD